MVRNKFTHAVTISFVRSNSVNTFFYAHFVQNDNDNANSMDGKHALFKPIHFVQITLSSWCDFGIINFYNYFIYFFFFVRRLNLWIETKMMLL